MSTLKYPELFHKVKELLDEKDFPYRAIDLESFINNYKAYMSHQNCSKKILPGRLSHLFQEFIHRRMKARQHAVRWFQENDEED